MSNNMRWRYGDTNPIVLPVADTTVIEIGDLVYEVGGEARPASMQADSGTEAGNQEAFHDAFAGVAMQASPDGVESDIRIATTGVFEFDSPSATYTVGDLVGADEDSGGTELLDQTVVAVATANLAVGRVAKSVNAADTKVLVDIESTLMKGGPQSMI